ncbi:hypothetical protein EC988_005440, partial [Linderina pennispora]
MPSTRPQHKLYPIEPNAIELMFGGLAASYALMTPTKDLNVYDHTTKYLMMSSLVMFMYYAIL